MAVAEHKLITRGLGGRDPGQGSGEQSPLKLKTF